MDKEIQLQCDDGVQVLLRGETKKKLIIIFIILGT